FYEDDVPDEWTEYNATNADFFVGLGSPGGAAKLGKVDYDTPMVKALPPMNEERSDVARPERRAPRRTLRASPWDALSVPRCRARGPPDGLAALTVGAPVAPVAPVVRDGLAEASAEPGYPTTVGTPALRRAAVDALGRRFGVTGLSVEAVLPAIGTKELIAGLPTQLGLGPGHTVVIPEIAYPTYEVGALLAGATVVRADSLMQLGPSSPALLYLNSPSNPSGKILGVDHLRKVVGWARDRGVIV